MQAQQPPSFLLICYLLAIIPSCRPTDKPTALPEDQFSRNIRNTDPLSAEEEKYALHLPPGFEIQLFASEPDIGKPLNMSFDNQGRMWLTQSYEYPFPDTSGFGRDRVSILQDTDGDGRADEISVFADSLNIPIGIQVVPDGAIVYSIPNIWHFVDFDHDDKVDERKVLYAGFQFGDTHGMVNNFVRSWDGWVHADHGFANTSRVAGTDGDTIVMESGNTFRFRLDGSRVEFTTTGRVNPYGYAYDELGYTYSVDCHTSPIYQLVRGADYPHFGKKPTGIGFGPALMRHEHGSTALAGLEYYIAAQFPQEYQHNFYYGDVVRSRVSRSNFQMQGTTPIIRQEEDFIISDDPWFRPVDVKLGPDGALYIADFYNRIIGHYEVPLDHPGRDRQRGRIWRVIYTGTGSSAFSPSDFSQLNLDQLVTKLDDPNLPLRMSVADQIVDRFSETAAPFLINLLSKNPASTKAQVQALWILFRLNQLNDEVMTNAMQHPSDTVKVHALRIAAELHDPGALFLEQVSDYLNHDNPHVQRQAVMVVGHHPDESHVFKLLDLLKNADREDTHFYYSIRQSLRDQLRDESVLNWVSGLTWQPEDSYLLADVLRGVDEPIAAQFLVQHLASNPEEPLQQQLYAAHAARWLPDNELGNLVNILRDSQQNKPDEAYGLFLAILEGIEAGNKQLESSGQRWAASLATSFFEEPILQYYGWKTVPIDRQPYSFNTWEIVDTTLQSRDGRVKFLSSNAMDGRGNGISVIESPLFKMPETLQFILRGQKNRPGEDQPPSAPTNRIELVSESLHEVLRQQEIEWVETDTLIIWQARDHDSENVYLRLIDGSASGGENIALGALNPQVVKLPRISPHTIVERQIFAARMAADYQLHSLSEPLQQILSSTSADVLSRNAAAEALLKLKPAETIQHIDQILDSSPGLKLKELLLVSLSESRSQEARTIISEYLSEVPYQSQREIVMNIGETTAGLAFLFDKADRAEINPRLLTEPIVIERLEDKMTNSQKNKVAIFKASVGINASDIDDIINKRLRGYVAAAYSIDKGQAYFSVFCSTCHEIRGEGGNIGPQLDGVGNWGARALSEKILDPNRNISQAFSTYNLELTDGSIRSGLLRREEGVSIIFANEQGQEFSVAKKEIQEQKLSPYTLMPDHFRETIPEDDFKHLLAYLLSLK